MEEEQVLKTRLALDDRPVKNLHRKVNMWLRNLRHESLESSRNTYETLLILLSNYKTNLRRHPAMQRVNSVDIEKYRQAVEKTDVTVKEVASQIYGLKEDLKEAQEVRNNKLQYDKEARKILQLETREKYHQSIQELKDDIEFLKREKESKEEALRSRKRKFAEVIDTVKGLQQNVEAERQEGLAKRQKLMDMDRGYVSSEDEGSDAESRESTPEPEQETHASHRFKERNNDDEEGIVADGDDAAVVVNGV